MASDQRGGSALDEDGRTSLHGKNAADDRRNFVKTAAGILAGAAALDLQACGFMLGPDNLPKAAAVVGPGPISAAASTIGVSGGTVSSGSSVTLTLQAKDAAGTNLTTGGAVVVFAVGGGGTSAGTISATTDHGDGTYTAMFTGTTAGTPTTIGATIAGVTVTGNAPPTVTVTPGLAARIAVSTGNNQSATVGTAVTVPPSVLVTDANANPVSGVSVTFAVASGGGSVTGGAATTGANGVATVGSWTLGTTAGPNTLTATSGSLTGSPVGFTATATAGPATQIAVNAGDNQSATVGTAVAVPPSVVVSDAFGNPVGGVAVTFAVATGGGAVAPTAAVSTGANGIAAATSWTLGPTAGANTLTATSGTLSGSPVTFTATGTSAGSGVLFKSDWSTATGVTAAALQDASQPVPWNQLANSNGHLTVVANPGGFPASMGNVLRVLVNPTSNGGGSAQVAVTGLPTPAVGQSLYYRFYMRFDIDETGKVQGINAVHPVETGTVTGINGGFAFKVGAMGDGTFAFALSMEYTTIPFPYTGWAYLNDTVKANRLLTGAVYRVELKATRAATNTISLDMRVYGTDDTTLIWQSTNIMAQGNSYNQTMATNGQGLSLTSTQDGQSWPHLSNWTMGTQGGVWSALTTDHYYYFGGVMIRNDTWCGPY